MSGWTAAIILAAGEGRRLGQDKALMDLGGSPAIRRAVAACRASGIERVVIVRRRGAQDLSTDLGAKVVVVDTDEMIVSLRAGLASLPAEVELMLVLPVDYAMVEPTVYLELMIALTHQKMPSIALPCCMGYRGHPIAFSRSIADEVLDPSTRTLRDVVRRSPARIVEVEVTDPWVLRDIDEPEDLLAAQTWRKNRGKTVAQTMRAHRSRRAFTEQPVGDRQLEWIVDTARHCATSSFIQAYSVVAVRDEARKDRCATLCANQDHIRQAPVFLAICADLYKIERACAEHGKSVNSDSLEIFLQAVIDASLFGQNVQLAAESEGLGGCMIGAVRNQPIELAKELGLPRQVFVAFGMTVGWPVDDPVFRERMPLAAVLHKESYTHDLSGVLESADEGMRAWARESNRRAKEGERPVNETRGWTDRMAHLWGGDAPPKGRAELIEHLRVLGFGLKGPN